MKKLKIPVFFLASLAFFAYLQWAPVFADPDSFYHAKMAMLMKEQGIIREFPWLKFTPFTQNFTDQHFLYHLFLIPFIVILPPLLGVKVFSILLAGAVIFFFYFFLRRWSARDSNWPLPFILILLSVPAFVLRISLAKAGPLSIIVLFIALSLIWQKRLVALGILSFFYVWLHGGWILMLILAACAALSEFLIYDRSRLKTSKQDLAIRLRSGAQYCFTVLGGVLAGLIFNPSFPNNLQFYWEQVVQIGLINYQDIIQVGLEWYPMRFADFISTNAFALILAISAFAVFFWRMKIGGVSDKTRFRQILTLYIFSGLLAIMTLKSQRFIEYFAPFFVLANAFLLDFTLPKNFSLTAEFKKILKGKTVSKIILFYLLAAWLAVFTNKGLELREQLTRKFDWHYLVGASQWLKNNTPYRSLIFSTQWSDWPMLFYHNDHNIYISGMDPTFFYRYDRRLFTIWAEIISAREANPAEKITEEFATNVVLVRTDETKLLEKIEKDVRFVLKYKDSEAKIYEIEN